jgi:hypothetical protein
MVDFVAVQQASELNGPAEDFETSRDHLDHLAWRCGAIESRRPGLDGGADGSALSDLFACVSPTAC